MKEDLQYLRERVDGIAETLARNTTVLEANTESLKEHIKRTEILEGQMESALIPVHTMKILGYILGFIGAVGGAVMGIQQLLR